MEDYFQVLGNCVGMLRPDIVIHRITGDGPKELLIAPLWTGDKRYVLNQFHAYLKRRTSGREGVIYMSEPFTLYKLIILYMLDKVDFPLTNAQISGFILDKGYTTYFKLQQALSELTESGFIREEATHSRTFYI